MADTPDIIERLGGSADGVAARMEIEALRAALSTAREEMREECAKVAREFEKSARMTSAVLHGRAFKPMTAERMAGLIAAYIEALPINPKEATDGDTDDTD